MYDAIFLDMDGPLADFHLEAIRAHMRVGHRFPMLNHSGTPLELTAQHLYDNWLRINPGKSLFKTYFPEYVKMDEEEWFPKFWKPIDQDPFFWRNMWPYPWFKDVVALCQEFAHEVVITTSPHNHPNCYQGKQIWLATSGLWELQSHFCKQKWRLSRPNTLLIDDHHRQVDDFAKPQCGTKDGWCNFQIPGRGSIGDPHNCHGDSILFPAPWNVNYSHSYNPVAYLRDQLELKATANAQR